MSEPSTLNNVATGLGIIFGFSGFVLGLISHFRDRAKVTVELQWDMDVTDNIDYDTTKKWGIVRVTNTGRRPIYISHAALKAPKGYNYTHLVLMEGIAGKKLDEGDPSKVYIVDQEGLEAYSSKWRKVTAQANDTTGKAWRSKKLNRAEKPSWAS
jgi:hypothetical protein